MSYKKIFTAFDYVLQKQRALFILHKVSINLDYLGDEYSWYERNVI